MDVGHIDKMVFGSENEDSEEKYVRQIEYCEGSCFDYRAYVYFHLGSYGALRVPQHADIVVAVVYDIGGQGWRQLYQHFLSRRISALECLGVLSCSDLCTQQLDGTTISNFIRLQWPTF